MTTLITNIGTNIYARVEHIRSEEREHWVSGLRQCELELETRLKPALEDNFLELEILQSRIEELKGKSVLLTEDKLEIVKLERQKKRIEMLVPGTIAELKVVEQERDRIVSEHQFELSQYSPEKLDRLTARDRYLAKCARVLAAAQIRPMGFNDSESQLYLSLPPGDQIAVMSQLQMVNNGAIALVANALGKVSPEQAARIVEIVNEEVTGILIGGCDDFT